MLRNKRESHYKGPRSKDSDKPKRTINPNNPVIAIDFDGTIVHNKYPYIENPNTSLINWIKANRDNYTFILWTCREGKQLTYAVDWLKEQGIEFDLINENVPWQKNEYGDSRKIWSNLYVDDKAVKPEELLRGN